MKYFLLIPLFLIATLFLTDTICCRQKGDNRKAFKNALFFALYVTLIFLVLEKTP